MTKINFDKIKTPEDMLEAVSKLPPEVLVEFDPENLTKEKMVELAKKYFVSETPKKLHPTKANPQKQQKRSLMLIKSDTHLRPKNGKIFMKKRTIREGALKTIPQPYLKKTQRQSLLLPSN